MDEREKIHTKPRICPKCSGDIFSVEYNYSSSHHYDGISEWACENAVAHNKNTEPTCDFRMGRFCGEALGSGESEPPYCTGGIHNGAVHSPVERPFSDEEGAGEPVEDSDSEKKGQEREVEVKKAVEDSEGKPAKPVEPKPAKESEDGEDAEGKKSPMKPKGSAAKKESFWEWLKRKCRELLEKGRKLYQRGKNLLKKLFRR